MPSARRFTELGVSGEDPLAALEPIERLARDTAPPREPSAREPAAREPAQHDLAPREPTAAASGDA